jgi:hypothetical protein
MKKLYILVILLSLGITQIYAQCYQCTGTNNTSFKIGNTIASGENSFAGGNYSTVSSDEGFVFGNQSIVNGLRGIAFGNTARVYQTDGIAIGNTVTSDAANSYLFGQNLSGSAANSITIGLGTSSSSLLSNDKAGSIMFGVTNNPSLTIVKPASGGDVGYLGIGTEAPEKMVHVVGNLLIDRSTYRPSSLQFRHLNSRDVGPGNPQVVPYYWDVFADNYGLKFNKVDVGSGITNQSMIISGSGRLGIGVAIPRATLHVGENILAEGNMITRDKFVLAPDITGKDSWEISRASTGLNFGYKDRTLQDILFLGNDGKVGIGTTTPTATFEVSGGFKSTTAEITSTLTAQSASITGT